MGAWISRSRPTLQLAAAVFCVVVGAVLMIGFRGFHSVKEDAFTGFVLGLLLLILGLAGLLFTGKQTVIVDPHLRRIDVVDSFLLGRRSRSIRFDAITGINIGFVGKKSNYVRRVVEPGHSGELEPAAPGVPGRGISGL